MLFLKCGRWSNREFCVSTNRETGKRRRRRWKAFKVMAEWRAVKANRRTRSVTFDYENATNSANPTPTTPLAISTHNQYACDGWEAFFFFLTLLDLPRGDNRVSLGA